MLTRTCAPGGTGIVEAHWAGTGPKGGPGPGPRGNNGRLGSGDSGHLRFDSGHLRFTFSANITSAVCAGN